MRQDLHQRLRCPRCDGRLGLQIETGCLDDVTTGWLDCWTCVERYPIVSGIPRFVPCETYADSFGLVWDAFRQAVLDSTLGVTSNRDRFFAQTAWSPNELQGKWVLELGCGAGRFTEIALDCGAKVVAVDYSTAVDVCQKNLEHHADLHLVQGDIYGLPLRPAQFDYVCCFGVLHRLPDAHSALLHVAQHVKPGGKLAVDIAPPRWIRRFGPTAWFRLITQRLSPQNALRFSVWLTDALLPIQRLLGSVPMIGRRLERLLPIAPIDTLQLCPPEIQQERARLAMCDRLTATYHHPGRVAKLQEWLQEAGIEACEVFEGQVIVGRGVRPAAASSGQPRAA